MDNWISYLMKIQKIQSKVLMELEKTESTQYQTQPEKVTAEMINITLELLPFSFPVRLGLSSTARKAYCALPN